MYPHLLEVIHAVCAAEGFVPRTSPVWSDYMRGYLDGFERQLARLPQDLYETLTGGTHDKALEVLEEHVSPGLYSFVISSRYSGGSLPPLSIRRSGGQVMDARIEAALEESIDSWEHKLTLAENGDYRNILLGRGYCPLCRECDEAANEDSCVGCPIKESTGQEDCQGTPYGDVIRAFRALKEPGSAYEEEFIAAIKEPGSAYKEEFIAAIKEELAFLKGLRST